MDSSVLCARYVMNMQLFESELIDLTALGCVNYYSSCVAPRIIQTS